MSEQKFKVGDRVGYTQSGSEDKGVVTGMEPGFVHVTWSDMGRDVIGTDNEYLEFIGSEESASDPVSPDHYKFPGGVEVINISEHLTSNGGQALQYIARATRLDGKIKGNPIEDLTKALFFAQREIDRLKEEA